MAKTEPDIAGWLVEAKQAADAEQVGMYLLHNGVVRATPRHTVRAEASAPEGMPTHDAIVTAVDFSYHEAGLQAALDEALTWEGVFYVRAWLNEGRIAVGESLMYVLVGADIRPHAISALERLVGTIKSNLVEEREIFDS